ncbi:MAG TPA: PilT/PilU family type 4a pilus ATPase [Acidobacteria bacterium]|nr:PilT/PilU family type 4a pilus ATPase [Acidobacteriota bacterium]
MVDPPSSAQVKQALQQLARGTYRSSEQRDQLLAIVAAAEGVPAGNIVWMLFRPDRGLREAASKLLQRHDPKGVAEALVAESSRQPQKAIWAAATTFLPGAPPGVAARLTELLDATNPKVSGAVTTLILEAPPVASLAPALWRILQGDDPELRAKVLERLEALPPGERDLPRWRELLGDPDPRVQTAAVRVLAANAPERFTGLLVEKLPAADARTREVLTAALAKLAREQGMEVADLVLPLLASSEATVRNAVASILKAVPDRTGVIRRFVEHSRNLVGWVRDRALNALLTLGPDFGPVVLELLRDPDPSIRATALAMLDSMEDFRQIEAVIPLLQDPDWWVRVSAANTLAQIGDRRAVGPLVKALEDEETRWAAVEALGRLGDPRALPALAKLLGSSSTAVRMEALLALRHFDHPNLMAAFRRVAENDPDRTVRTRALECIEELSAQRGQPVEDMEKLRSKALHYDHLQGEPSVHALLIAARERSASDLHLTPGRSPMLRRAMSLMPLGPEPISDESITAMIREILNEGQWNQLQERQQLDFCYHVPSGGRFRGNVFVDRCGLNAVFRVIPETPPTLDQLGIPDQLHAVVHEHQGLILVAGPAGSGKSTTLTALVNLFNEERNVHIITLEDPVEFVHPSKRSLINQREVGRDTGSFARALRAALREDPDVIVIGDLRDNETISLALTAAETGHVVFGTLSSTGAIKAVDRIITSFPAKEQPQIRMGLADSLTMVVAQKLLKRRDGTGLVACFEILMGIPAVGNLIREGKTLQLRSAIQTGRTHGMMTFDDSLKSLLAKDLISKDTARRAALSKKEFKEPETQESNEEPNQ